MKPLSPLEPTVQPAEERHRRAWTLASLLLVLFALAVLLDNAFRHAPLGDFDSAGHGLNVFALQRGELPDPNVWSGFHPPLAHALVALLWRALPPSVELHVVMRLLSIVAVASCVLIVWRVLRRLFSRPDAAVVAAALLCAPALALDSTMLGNESMCALFLTAVLARLVDLGRDALPGARNAALTGLLAALAAASKATGVIAVGTTLLAYAWVYRRSPLRALLPLALLVAIPALVAGPHYLRLSQAGDGSFSSFFFAGAPLDGDLRSVAELQPPGVRHVSDYWSIPAETFTYPDARVPSLQGSVPGLLYASAWAGAQSPHLQVRADPERESSSLRATKSALALLGLLPSLLLAYGALRLARERALLRRVCFPLLVLGLLSVSFLRYTWTYPIFATVKSSFLVSGLLPVSILLGLGLAQSHARLRAPLRVALLLTGLAQIGGTWHGWWGEGPVAPPRIARGWDETAASLGADADSSVSIVERYYAERVRDPIRSLELLDDRFHETHGLRVSRMLAQREIENAGAPSDATELERARLAWITYLGLGWVPAKLSAQEITLLQFEVAGDLARVVARVVGPGAPPFRQIFVLVRGDQRVAWRIQQVELQGVSQANFHDARAAAPRMEWEELVQTHTNRQPAGG